MVIVQTIFRTSSSAGDLSRPAFPEDQGGGSHTGRAFMWGFPDIKTLRSEQLRDRYVTFVQKG